MGIKSLAKAVTPQPVWAFLKRIQRHGRWRLAQVQGVTLTKELIGAGLAQIGVRSGDCLLVHSSLTALGNVEGGPDAVVDALLAAVGPEGTLAMPAFPAVGEWMDYVLSDPLFDPKTSHSSNGRITDLFWRRPGVLRSLHPTHSVAACGPHAAYLVQDHDKSSAPFDSNSPYARLIELNGRILHLGSPFWATPSFHVVEDAVPSFPRQVYLRKPIPMRYLDHDGIERVLSVWVHDPDLASMRIDKVKAKERQIYEACRERGVLCTGKIGPATVHLIEAQALERLLEELVTKGVTIYV